MIHYHLRCADGHEFDGWFSDSAGFETQRDRGLLTCPECGTSSVERALMAPAIGLAAKKRGWDPAPSVSGDAAAVPSASVPDNTLPVPTQAPQAQDPAVVDQMAAMRAELRSKLRALRREVEANLDYVGPKFADEARKIHNGESEARGIYGEATPDENAALADEGIEVMPIPWVPNDDA